MHSEETYVFGFCNLAKKEEICNFITQGLCFFLLEKMRLYSLFLHRYMSKYDLTFMLKDILYFFFKILFPHALLSKKNV